MGIILASFPGPSPEGPGNIHAQLLIHAHTHITLTLRAAPAGRASAQTQAKSVEQTLLFCPSHVSTPPSSTHTLTHIHTHPSCTHTHTYNLPPSSTHTHTHELPPSSTHTHTHSVTAPLISDESYWKRCCQTRWSLCDVSAYQHCWKTMYLQRNLEEAIETFVPGQSDIKQVGPVSKKFVSLVSGPLTQPHSQTFVALLVLVL